MGYHNLSQLFLFYFLHILLFFYLFYFLYSISLFIIVTSFITFFIYFIYLIYFISPIPCTLKASQPIADTLHAETIPLALQYSLGSKWGKIVTSLLLTIPTLGRRPVCAAQYMWMAVLLNFILYFISISLSFINIFFLLYI